MAYTAKEIRAVRLMVPDADAIYGANEDEYMFEDSDIEIFLDTGRGNTMWAAGLAMIAVGNSEAMIGKVIRNYETETDASKLQREWRSSGTALIEIGRAQVLDGEVGIFEIAFPEWEGTRHPEGMSHGSYQIGPGSFQW